MQQQPPRGRLFPDRPVEQTNAPRFSSNNAQGYEAQTRMQQTGSYGMSQSARYGTGSFQAVRDSQPVNTLPPMASMPTASNYAAAQQTLSNSQRFSTGSFQPVRDSQPVNTMPPVTTVASAQQPVVQQGAPVMMQTVQGTPVLISQEQLQAVAAQLAAQGLIKPAGEESAKSKADKKAEKKARKEKKMKVIARPSLFWMIFGIIGIATVLYLLYGQVVVPLRVILYDLTNGGA